MSSQSRRPNRQRSSLRFSSSVLVAVWAALGCTHHTTSEASADAGPPTECRDYLELYAGCMHRLSPQTPQIADARVATARTALDRITDRAQLRRACIAGATQIRTSCQ